MTELNKLIEISKSDFNLAMTMLKGLDITVTEFVEQMMTDEDRFWIPGIFIVTESHAPFKSKVKNPYRIVRGAKGYFPPRWPGDDRLNWRNVSSDNMKNYLITYLTAVVNNKTKLKNEN